MLDNFEDGLACLFGSESQSEEYNDFNSSCSLSLGLILGYVASNVVVLACIDRVLETSNQILGRVLAVSILFAFVALGIYDTEANKGLGGLFGGTRGAIDIIALVLLFAGMEIYGSDPEPDVELIANYYSRAPVIPTLSTNICCCGALSTEEHLSLAIDS